MSFPKQQTGTKLSDEEVLKGIGIEKKKRSNVIKDDSINLPEIGRGLLFGFSFSFIYITIDNRKRFVLFVVGCSTIVLVAAIMANIQNIMRKVPLIFVRISEDTTGEGDIYLLPRFTNSTQNVFINYTDIDAKFDDNELVLGTSPRWMFQGTIRARDENPEDIREPQKALIVITDTEREDEMKIGRIWPYRQLGEMECHVKSQVLWNIGLKPNLGARAIITLNLNAFLGVDQSENMAMEEGVYEEEWETEETINQEIEASAQNGTNVTGTVDDIINFLGLDEDLIIEDIPDFLDILGYDFSSVENNTIRTILTHVVNGTLPESTGSLLNFDLDAEFTIVDAVHHTYGRYPSAFGNLIVIDSKYFNIMMGHFFDSNPLLGFLMSAQTGGDEAMSFDMVNMDWHENAMMLVGMYTERFSTYRLRDKAKEAKLVELTDSIIDSVGANESLQIQLPTAEGLFMMDMIMIFLDQIFMGITVCLSAMGTILIFSLLLSNVEEKTYEFGMLRAMGLQQPTLVEMTFIQAFYFAVPGLIVALIVAAILNIPLEYCFYYFIKLPTWDLTFSWDAIVLPVSLGLAIPFVSNIIPVRAALGKSLRNSLDITRQSMNETKVKFTKLENLGLEPWQATVAITMIIFGFVVYYVMPLSFIFDQMNIFMYTLEFIFIGMLAGLCIIAVILQPIAERILLEIVLFINFIFPKDRRMKQLIIKNLAGHRSRSRKTFLMFTLTVGFVVFSGVNLRQLISTFTGNMGLLTGSHLNIASINPVYNIRSPELLSFLEHQKKIGNITDFAFSTFELEEYHFVSKTKFSNLAIFPREDASFYGVERNWLSAAFDSFYIPTETNSGLSPKKIGIRDNLLDSLYKEAGKAKVRGLKDDYLPETIYSGRKVEVSQEQFDTFDPGASYRDYYDVIIAEGCRDYFGIDSDSATLLNVRLRNGYYEKFIAKPVGMISKFPGYFFSSYAFAALDGTVLMSIPQFERLANISATRLDSPNSKYKFTELIYQTVIIKMPGDNEKFHRRQFVNKIRVFLDPDMTSIMDVVNLLNSMYGAVIGFTAVQYVSGCIGMIFCTYMLTLSFISNVRDNSWEFGVLRATGFNANLLIRAYIYEAVVLVMSAFILGLAVGVVTGSSLIAQFNLFLEMPFVFEFPFDLVFSLFGTAVFLAIVGSYIPARVIKEKEIAQVLRGVI